VNAINDSLKKKNHEDSGGGSKDFIIKAIRVGTVEGKGGRWRRLGRKPGVAV